MTRRAVAVVLTLAVVLVGCRGDDPQAELRDAAAATVDDTLVFALTARADRAALDGLGGGAADAAAFLEDFAIAGERSGDGLVRVGLSIGGDAPLLETLVTPDDELFLRSGLGELLGAEAADPEEQLGPALDELGVSPAGRQALVASFGGGWIALTDVGGIGELLGAAGEVEADEGAPAVAGDLDALLAATRVTGARDAGDVRRLDVEVERDAFGGLFEAPGQGPDRLPGTVVVRDGRIIEVRLDLAPDDGAGTVELVLTLSGHGAEVVLTRPEAAATLTGAELFELLRQLESADAAP